MGKKGTSISDACILLSHCRSDGGISCKFAGDFGVVSPVSLTQVTYNVLRAYIKSWHTEPSFACAHCNPREYLEETYSEGNPLDMRDLHKRFPTWLENQRDHVALTFVLVDLWGSCSLVWASARTIWKWPISAASKLPPALQAADWQSAIFQN